MTTQINVPGVQPFNVHGDPNQVAQNWEKWRKSFEYSLIASGITTEPRKKGNAGTSTQELFV